MLTGLEDKCRGYECEINSNHAEFTVRIHLLRLSVVREVCGANLAPSYKRGARVHLTMTCAVCSHACV